VLILQFIPSVERQDILFFEFDEFSNHSLIQIFSFCFLLHSSPFAENVVVAVHFI